MDNESNRMDTAKQAFEDQLDQNKRDAKNLYLWMVFCAISPFVLVVKGPKSVVAIKSKWKLRPVKVEHLLPILVGIIIVVAGVCIKK